MTTVHKKNDAPSPALGRLAGLAPKIAAAPKKSSFESKLATAKWEASGKDAWRDNGNDYYLGKSEVRISESSHLARMGANWSSVGRGGSIKMTQGEIYDYLREGIGIAEAAALQSMDPSPERWTERGNANGALPGPLSYASYGDKARLVGIKNAVDALREHEVKPQVAQRLLLNGFNDDHLGGVLTMDQKIKLFDRFKYQASMNEGVETNASATMDALMDGRLPYELFEGKYDRPSLTAALDCLYPKKRQGAIRSREKFDDEGREYLKENPQEIVNVVAAMESGERKCSFEEAYRSVRKYGAEASKEYTPLLLMMKREDGSELGVSGARFALEFRDYCKELLGDDQSVTVGGYDRNIYVKDRSEIINLHTRQSGYNHIAEMREAGANNEQVLDLIYKQRLNGTQALAVVRGDAVPSLGTGWL